MLFSWTTIKEFPDDILDDLDKLRIASENFIGDFDGFSQQAKIIGLRQKASNPEYLDLNQLYMYQTFKKAVATAAEFAVDPHEDKNHTWIEAHKKMLEAAIFIRSAILNAAPLLTQLQGHLAEDTFHYGKITENNHQRFLDLELKIEDLDCKMDSYAMKYEGDAPKLSRSPPNDRTPLALD